MKTKKNSLSYLIALLCGVLLFSHELVPNYIKGETKAHYELRNEYLENGVQPRNKALDAVKQSSDKDIYSEYLVAKENASQLKAQLQELEKQESFRGFDNFKMFLGEFSWSFCLALFCLYILLTVRHRKDVSIITSALLFYSLYFVAYCFSGNTASYDYPFIAYGLSAVGVGCLLLVGVYSYHRYKREYLHELTRALVVDVPEYFKKALTAGFKAGHYDNLKEIDSFKEDRQEYKHLAESLIEKTAKHG